jgi:hypothetical protein
MAYVSPSADWDANFTQILSRTRDNISKINMRYDGADS